MAPISECHRERDAARRRRMSIGCASPSAGSPRCPVGVGGKGPPAAPWPPVSPQGPLSPEPSRPFPAAALTDVPLDGNLPEALLEAGVRGAGGVAAVPFGGGGHGGAEREHTGLPAAPAHFKSPASRWAGWPCPATTPREEAEALPPPPSRRVAAAPAPAWPGERGCCCPRGL